MNWSNWLAEQRAVRLNNNLHRNRLTYAGRQGVDYTNNNEALVNFSSNDYLGLAGHPELAECLAESAKLHGVGSGASHMVCGHHELHQQLETALASFVGSQRVLIFSSGYMANIGLPQALTGRGDLILSDRLNHASLIDGVRLSHAKTKRFQHRDVNHAQRISSSADYQRCLLVTDGVFSMDGDIAPISELRALAAERN
ncbi:MAG: aminotransferase class I/II-fold pyridoxal phosphate-dependent enzyme, partial [Proteobacteria bacterium]|nr:aminotransferase class I/II-fold pyridoxal phosphate-dependent enzyme [Pseudomonadota bacterium]